MLINEFFSFMKKTAKVFLSPRNLFWLYKFTREKNLQGLPIVFIPGFLCDDCVMSFLKLVFSEKGAVVHGWENGRNLGSSKTIPKLSKKIRAIRKETGNKPILLGWSLGGGIARALANSRPDDIGGVITMGTPVDPPDASGIIKLLFCIFGEKVDQKKLELVKKPLSVPSLALFSKEDTVVVTAAEEGVSGGHFGFLLGGRNTLKRIDNFLRTLPNPA